MKGDDVEIQNGPCSGAVGLVRLAMQENLIAARMCHQAECICTNERTLLLQAHNTSELDER